MVGLVIVEPLSLGAGESFALRVRPSNRFDHHSAIAIDKIRAESSWGFDEFNGFELLQNFLPQNPKLKLCDPQAHAAVYAKTKR